MTIIKSHLIEGKCERVKLMYCFKKSSSFLKAWIRYTEYVVFMKNEGLTTFMTTMTPMTQVLMLDRSHVRHRVTLILYSKTLRLYGWFGVLFD